MQTGTAFLLSLFAASVMAAVSPDEAATLGTSLTPIGAEKAGNAAGTIPAWTGGLAIDAAPVDSNGFLGNPFAGEKPLFTITAQNVDQYKDKLTPGQQAMFKRYPDSYRIPVYTTHRSANFPAEVREATKTNALNTNMVQNGNGLEQFRVANAFPIPKNGLEVIWNHITRYRGGSVKRYVTQATPQTNGSYSLVYFDDEFVFPSKLKDYDASKPSNILFYFKQKVTAPSRLRVTCCWFMKPWIKLKSHVWPGCTMLANAVYVVHHKYPMMVRVPQLMVYAPQITSICTTVRLTVMSGNCMVKKKSIFRITTTS